MTTAIAVVLAAFLAVPAPQANPKPAPKVLTPCVWVAEKDDSGLVPADYADRILSRNDVTGELVQFKGIRFSLVRTPEAAQLSIEILNRESDPKDHRLKSVQVRAKAAGHSQVFVGRDDDDHWGAAAVDAAKQVRAWAIANYATFSAPVVR
jgi:hypothetical protein